MLGELINLVWQRLSPKKGGAYLAAFIICAGCAIIKLLSAHTDMRYRAILVPFFGMVGVGAVGIMKLGGCLQTRVDQSSNAGRVLKICYALLMLLTLLLLVVGLCAGLVYFL